MYILVVFILLSCPYTLLCVSKSFWDFKNFSPLYTSIYAFISKIDIVWPALFTLFEDRDIRDNFQSLKACQRVSVTYTTEMKRFSNKSTP